MHRSGGTQRPGSKRGSTGRGIARGATSQAGRHARQQTLHGDKERERERERRRRRRERDRMYTKLQLGFMKWHSPYPERA